MSGKKYTYLSSALNDLDIPLQFRKGFYSFLQKINITNENKTPTPIAIQLGLVNVIAKIPPYFSWNVTFVMDKLNEYGFPTDARFAAATSEYAGSYFTKKQFQSTTYMCEPLTSEELYTILEPYTDDQGKPTNETLKQNIAKIVPGYPIYSWDIGSIRKTYEHYTNNKKNTNLQDLISYINNNH